MIAFVAIQLILFSPRELTPLSGEDGDAIDRSLILEDFRSSFRLVLPELPDSAPSYSAQGARWLTAQGDQTRWKIESERMATFPGASQIFSSQVRMQIYDRNQFGSPTLVLAQEAVFQPTMKRVDLYGDVRIQMPDGFLIQSEFAYFFTDLGLLLIPPPWPTKGSGVDDGNQKLSFSSIGLAYDTRSDQFVLFSSSLVTFNSTQIESDHSVLDRKKKTGSFERFSFRPVSRRFIWIRKPDLTIRARTATLTYESHALRVMAAKDDVYLEDRSDPKSVRYATCGLAQFDRQFDQIDLTEYPQVYQDQDTIVGDRIQIRRKENIVDVERSNVFTE